MTIVEFLTARLDAEEKIARAAYVTTEDWVAYQDPYGTARVTGMSGSRVLREVAAKRAIVAAWITADEMAGPYPGTDAGHEMGLHEALVLLAQPYAEHPDFDPAWRV